jgi:quercetin 2,3-dioxygenase
MKTILHKADSRGHNSFGWLNSYHSFSFGEYHHPERMQFGALRVLNDDTVQAGMGFGQHPHNNMEIISIPLYGDLHHKDSTGRDEIIRQDDVQIMSAGSGISHSETNANRDKEVKFLQIWVKPKEKNIEPRYQQKSFKPAERLNQLLTVVAPNDENAVWINQDAWFSMANLSKGHKTTYEFKSVNSGVYVFVIKGKTSINTMQLNERDGLGIWEENKLEIVADEDTDILLIEVPMNQ